MSEILILLGVLLASLVGTITGFGTSTVLVPVLLLFYPLPEVLLFVGVIHWFGNIWKMYFFRKGKSLALLLGFGVTGAIGSFLGARLIVDVPQEWLTRSLGIFLILYCGFLYWKPKAKLKATAINSSVGGFLSGVSSGIFGIGGTIRSAFLIAFGLKKATYLFTVGAIGLIIDSTRLATYIQQDFRLNELHLTWLLASVPASLLGAWIATKLVGHMSQQIFRIVVMTGLFFLGLYYIVS